MSDTDFDMSEIATEARSGFNLMDRLEGRSPRTTTVTVFIDEVNGAKHKILHEQLEAAKGPRDNPADPADYAELEAETKRVAKLVYQSGLTLHLRAVPKIVSKKADREARKELKVKGQVPPELLVELSDRYTAHILSDSVEKWIPHETGETITHLSPEYALALKEHLPTGEYDRIDKALSSLSFTAQISDAVTADADF